MSIEEILDLEQLEVDIYRGGVFSPESGFLQRTFGGHVAGQSLVSAVRTVDPKFQVHSLHGYFLRPGDARSPGPARYCPTKAFSGPAGGPAAGSTGDCSTWHWVQFDSIA